MMFRQERGYEKVLSLSDGTVSIVLMGNPLWLNKEERELVYELVDRIIDFEKQQLGTMGNKGLRPGEQQCR